jgi:uncharacterized membrane protein YfcA
MPETATSRTSIEDFKSRSAPAAILAGAGVGVLGGLIGLGGAEFRLPLLIGLFGFTALHAVIVNKATSLIVVITALPVRSLAIPFGDLAERWTIAVNLLAGSLVGAWLGASWATRMRTALLYRVLAALLVAMGVVLFLTHQGELQPLNVGPTTQAAMGVVAGFAIGVVASIMGVAGGELLIPTLVILFGLDVKLAGSMSLAVSLPTMIVAFSRYSRDDSFAILSSNRRLVALLGAGSVVGAVLGGILIGTVPDSLLTPTLSLILGISAIRVWRH